MGIALLSEYLRRVVSAKPDSFNAIYGAMPTLDLAVCTAILLVWAAIGIWAIRIYSTPLSGLLRRLLDRFAG
ncbi:hypothetical protein ACIPY3_16380 [Paenarthrobacter sp. NPDC089714]|uniref:hypothetical protein n=1 Tax=Paenarthrobacter sp. NPDC089714 TaxID=3364377 RepID=UPI0037F5008A